MTDPVGAVLGAISLAIAIKQFCESLKSGAGNDRLVVQIQNDSEVLGHFAKIFGSVQKRVDIGSDEKILLENICQVLNPLLERLHAWIEKRERMKAETAGTTAKLADKVKSVLWKNNDMGKLAAELTAWNDRYFIRLGLLPSGLKEKLLLGNVDGESIGTHKAVKDLRLAIDDLDLSIGESPALSRSEGLLMASESSSRVFGSFDRQRVVVEYKSYQVTLSGANLERLSASVRRLALILHHADSGLCRILKCIAYIHQGRKHRFALVYSLPYQTSLGSKPRTLLDLIKATKPSASDPSKFELLAPQHPLNDRFELARKVACAVLYVQAMGWVHKSIRTNNVIMLTKENDNAPSEQEPLKSFPKSLGNPYLCGFDAARQDKAYSDQQGDAFWEFNVYRHPARQGLQLEERYSMNHDIYSLGVVLLELGIWKPLLALSGLKALRTSSNPDLVKDFFLKVAAESLPVVMGQKYFELVKFCLEINGENPITAVTAIDEVLSKLEEMSLGLH